MKKPFFAVIIAALLATSCGHNYSGQYTGVYEQTGTDECTIKLSVDVPEGLNGPVKLAIHHYFRKYLCFSDVVVSDKAEYKGGTLMAYFTLPADPASTIAKEQVERHLSYSIAKKRGKVILCSQDTLAMPVCEVPLVRVAKDSPELDFQIHYPVYRVSEEGINTRILNGPVKAYYSGINKQHIDYEFDQAGLPTKLSADHQSHTISRRQIEGGIIVSSRGFYGTQSLQYNKDGKLISSKFGSVVAEMFYDSRGRCAGSINTFNNGSGRWYKVTCLYDSRGLWKGTHSIYNDGRENTAHMRDKEDNVYDDYGNFISKIQVPAYSHYYTFTFEYYE